MTPEFQRGLRHLAAKGLNLIAILDTATFSDPIKRPIEKAGFDLEEYPRLVLAGNGGRLLWRAFQAAGGPGTDPDPLDHYSKEGLGQALTNIWGVAQADVAFLYPLTDVLVPLQQLGTLAGWSHRSPIGSDIHPDYGLWFAYRAAALVKADLPLKTMPSRPSPCDSCVGRPCMTACPAQAVGAVGSFNLNACISHRVSERSTCATRCLARLACPEGTQHRYPAEQIAYHYGLSLEGIERYLKSKEG